jgi:hypothetical protein
VVPEEHGAILPPRAIGYPAPLAGKPTGMSQAPLARLGQGVSFRARPAVDWRTTRLRLDLASGLGKYRLADPLAFAIAIRWYELTSPNGTRLEPGQLSHDSKRVSPGSRCLLVNLDALRIAGTLSFYGEDFTARKPMSWSTPAGPPRAAGYRRSTMKAQAASDSGDTPLGEIDRLRAVCAILARAVIRYRTTQIAREGNESP